MCYVSDTFYPGNAQANSHNVLEFSPAVQLAWKPGCCDVDNCTPQHLDRGSKNSVSATKLLLYHLQYSWPRSGVCYST
jgi:hypothetical protein